MEPPANPRSPRQISPPLPDRISEIEQAPSYRMDMAQDVDVMVHSADSRPKRRPTWTRRLVGLLIGIVAGLSIGQLSIGLSESSDGSPLADPDVFPALPDGAGGPLSDPRLELTGIELTEDVEYQLVSGSLDGPVTEKPLRTGDWDAVTIDQSGQWFAVGGQTPDGKGLLLVGSELNLTPLSTTTSSFAWHDSRPGMLSFIERDPEGGWQLKVSEMGARTRVIVSVEEPLGDIAAWGDWGWALQTSSDSITILDESGQRWERADGLALDSHHTGWILTIHPVGLNIVVPGGGVVYLDIEHETIGGVGSASFSPDRKKLILIGPRGTKITDINGERPAITIPLPAVPRATAWSSESRYALIAEDRGIVIVDTDSQEGSLIHAWQDRSLLALVARQ